MHKRHFLTLLLGSVIFCDLAGCHAPKSPLAFVDETYRLRGFIDTADLPKSPLDGANQPANTPASLFGGYSVDSDGVRKPIDGFQFDAISGAFEFKVKRSDLFARLALTLPEMLALMGVVPPADALRNGHFGAADVGLVRLEMFAPQELTKMGNVSAYYQSFFPVPRAAALGRVGIIELVGDKRQAFRTRRVGKARVKVVDETGKPLKGVWVQGVPLTEERQSLGSAFPMFPWKNPEYSAAFTKTDDLGVALVFPLPFDVEEPKYQIAATAPGRCYVVSPQAYFSKEKNNEVSLTLPQCPEAERGSRKVAWMASFGAGLNIETDARTSLTKAYINSSSVPLTLVSRTRHLRGFAVRIFPGQAAEGKPVSELKLFTFASALDVPLPTYLDGIAAKDGQFAIEIESLFSPQDKEEFGDAPRQLLIGERSTSQPLAPAALFEVKSAAGVENVISGISGNRFTVKYSDCKAGLEIGVLVGNEYDRKQTKFFPCAKEGNSFELADLKPLFLPNGGEQPLVFFVRNKYGSTSLDDLAKGSNRKTVYVDYGVPLVTTGDPLFGSNYGFAPKGATPATDAVPYSFIQNPVEIRAATLDQFVLRFTQPAKCAMESPDLLADGTGAAGKALYKFTLLQKATAAAPLPSATDWLAGTPCGTDRTLAPGDVVFPTNASQPAVMYFQVLDAAGNPSNVLETQVPPCGGPSQEAACWRN